MNYNRRFEIISKEVVTADDLAELTGKSKSTAYEIINSIKRTHDRLGLSGMVHIQDYIDHYGLDIRRFLMPKKERPYEVDCDEDE